MLRALTAGLLLTASGYLLAGPGGLASCVASQRELPPVAPGQYRPSYLENRSCWELGILPVGLGITGAVVALQGRRGISFDTGRIKHPSE